MAAFRHACDQLRTIVPICALALSLSACASMQELAGLPHPGIQNDGTYVMTAQEQDLGCRALEERSKGLQEQMQELSQQAMKEMQQVPQTVANAWGRLFGDPGDGVPAVAQYNAARAESAALDATLARKGCPSDVNTASIKR